MKKIFAIILCNFFISCSINQLINEKDVSKIIIIKMLHQNKDIQHVISSKDSISCIIKKINTANDDPAVFITKYKIIIQNRDNTIKTILGNMNRIKIDGKTYKLDENFESEILYK